MPMFFRAFRTRGVYVDYPSFRRVVQQGMRGEIAPDIALRLRSFASGWKAQPNFKTQTSLTAKGISVDAVPEGFGTDAWGWVSRGVRGRVIRPTRTWSPRSSRRTGRIRRAALAFTGRSGGRIYRYQVNWPGIRARNFEEQVVRDYRPTFLRKMDKIVGRATRRAQRATRYELAFV